MAKTKTKLADAPADRARAKELPPVPAGAVRLHVKGQPKADVFRLADGRFRVVYPEPQIFWTRAPDSVEVEASGPGEAYDLAGGITERPTLETERPVAA